MEARARAKALFPVVGTMTAVITGTGALAVAHVAAPAGAEATATDVAGAAAAPAGALQGCEAYFGFGKSSEALNLVAFDVHDQNGDDGVEHAVPDDTDVVLVLHFEDGDLECTPFEVAEDDWAAAGQGDISDFPLEYPGPGHYVYPSVNLHFEDKDLGELTGVGFRVTGFPGGEHTLVSPTGEVALPDFQLDPDDLFWQDIQVDPRVSALITDRANADATAAYEAAAAACLTSDDYDSDDPDLLAAVNVLAEFIGDPGDITDAGCFTVARLNALASEVLGVQEAVAQVQPIVLALPEAPAPTPTPTPAAPVAVNDVAFTG